jgi:hypothetical protein
MTGETDRGRKHAGKPRGSRVNTGLGKVAGQVRAWYASLRRPHAGLGRPGRARTASRRRASRLSAVMTVAAAVALVPAAGMAAGGPPQAPRAGAAPARSAAAVPGPFVTLLFSRTEISAADNCVEDDADVARLDTIVAPFLHSYGMAGTGTLVTDGTDDTTRHCVHYNDDLTASWADATNLAQNYGWSFVSHTATYPSAKKLESLTPAQAYHETCGTIATIASHGLPGATGMIAYPGGEGPKALAVIKQLQANYGQNCFDWGRQYVHSGFTDVTAASTPPHWQHTVVLSGGACNDPTAWCYSGVVIPNNRHYTLPSTIIAQIQALQPGQWFTVQAYLLVTGRQPAYTQNGTRWNCTSPNPALHYTNHEVRYCWTDYQQIIRAIAADPSITVTDPLTVGRAFGRPFK